MASFDLKDLEPTDWATGLGQIYDRQTQQLETFIQQSKQRDAQQEAKTKASGEMLQNLAKFSATATEAVMQGQEKREEKERNKLYGQLAEIGVSPFQAAQVHLQREDANNKDNQIVNKFGETITLSDSVKQELEVILGRNERRTREVLAMALGNNWGALMEGSDYSARLKAAANNPGLATEIKGEAYRKFFGEEGLNLRPEVYQTYASKGVNEYYNGNTRKSQSKGNNSAKVAYTNTHVQHITESAISQTGLATKSFIEARGIIEAGLPQYPGVDNKKEASEIALGHLKTAYTSGTLTSNNFQAELDHEVPCGSLHAGRCYNNQKGESVTTLRHAYFGEGGESVSEWTADIDKAFGEHTKDLIKIEKNSINGELYLLTQDQNFDKLPIEEQQKLLSSLSSRWSNVSNEDNPMLNSAIQRMLYPDKRGSDIKDIEQSIKLNDYEGAVKIINDSNDPFLKAQYAQVIKFNEYLKTPVVKDLMKSVETKIRTIKNFGQLDPTIDLSGQAALVKGELMGTLLRSLRENWENDPLSAAGIASATLEQEWESNGGGQSLGTLTLGENSKLKYIYDEDTGGFPNHTAYLEKAAIGLQEFHRPITQQAYDNNRLEVDKILAKSGLTKDNWTIEKFDNFLLTNAHKIISIPDMIGMKERGQLSPEIIMKADYLGVSPTQLYEYALLSLGKTRGGKRKIENNDLLLRDNDLLIEKNLNNLLKNKRKELSLMKRHTIYKGPLFLKRSALLAAGANNNVELNQLLFNQKEIPLRIQVLRKPGDEQFEKDWGGIEPEKRVEPITLPNDIG